MSEDLVRPIGGEAAPALLPGGAPCDAPDREPEEWVRIGATIGAPPDECVRSGGGGLFFSQDLPDSVRLTGGVTGELPAVQSVEVLSSVDDDSSSGIP